MIKTKKEIISNKMAEVEREQKLARTKVLQEGLKEKYDFILPKINDKNKIKLFLDADDVIMDTSQALIDKYNKEFESNPLHLWVDKSDVWDWGYKIPCPLASPDWIDSFFSNKSDVMSISPMPYSRAVLRKLDKVFDITVATIGTKENIIYKIEWFEKYFPFINNYIFINNKGCKMDKSIINMAGHIFVDDNGENLKSSNADIKITFGDEREYNKGEKIRAYNMNELEAFLISFASELY